MIKTKGNDSKTDAVDVARAIAFVIAMVLMVYKLTDLIQQARIATGENLAFFEMKSECHKNELNLEMKRQDTQLTIGILQDIDRSCAKLSEFDAVRASVETQRRDFENAKSRFQTSIEPRSITNQ